jgi:hypothetical protein
MVKPTRTPSARGRSKSRTRTPKTVEEASSPVRKSKRKTPKKKVESSSSSSSSEADDATEPEIKKSPVKKVAVKKTVTKKKVATAAAAEKEVFGTTIACRIMYLQLFAAGVGAIFSPLEVMKLAYGDSVQSNEVTVNAQKWLGVFILQLSFAVIAGAQGNHADQKKTLQYLMFLPLMAGAMLVAHMDVVRPEFLNGVVGVSFVDLGLMIWGCYYSD